VALLLGTAGASVIALPSEAATDPRLEEDHCAEALRLNTVAALEDFLRRYPDNSACRALALNALGETKERGGGQEGNNGYNGGN